QPVAARADHNAVNNLLAIAAIVPQRRFAAGAIDSQKTGLAEPAATIRFNDATTLAIGKHTPMNAGAGQRYVRSGDTVAVAAIGHAGLLDMPWPQWIAPQLLAADAQLQTLQLPEFTLSRNDTGGWRVSPASRDRGADAAQFVIDAWR